MTDGTSSHQSTGTRQAVCCVGLVGINECVELEQLWKKIFDVSVL